MLRNHEIELIARLVQGTLKDESEARALIEGSEAARAEFEAQTVAYETLRAAAPVSLTETERSALRRDVWTALRETPQPSRRPLPWYYKLAPVAAGLFVVVGLAAVLSQGGLDRLADDGAGADTAAELTRSESALTTAASGEPESADDAAEVTGGLDGSADLADEEAAPAAPAAPAVAEQFARIAELVRSRGETDTTLFRTLGTLQEVEEATECLERSGLPDYAIVGEVEVATEDESSTATYLVVVQSDEEIDSTTQVVFIDVSTCEIAHVED